jgi:hypothetical protein
MMETDAIDRHRVGRRRARRFQILASGTYRTGSGSARTVHLTDLSQTGCRFIDPRNGLAVGTRLTVKIGGVGPFDALVYWIDGAVVGLRFCDQLYPPYFDHLLAAWTPPAGQFERRLNRR